MAFPTDIDICVSYINMKLRDGHGTLEDLCAEEGEDEDELLTRLSDAGYVFDGTGGSFRKT